ncbi:MAG TPA: hypothetical protein VGB81_05110 [Devosia sp.]|jgi:CheY-like chemotaxis protein
MLDGTNVLVIEEEFLIALDIQRMLEGLNSGQVLFARSALEASSMHDHWSAVGLAIVELSLQPNAALELVQRLLDQRIPVVLCSADMAFSTGAPQYPQLPLVIKPMAETDLVAAIRKVLIAKP